MALELHPLAYNPVTHTWIAYNGDEVKGTADASDKAWLLLTKT